MLSSGALTLPGFTIDGGLNGISCDIVVASNVAVAAAVVAIPFASARPSLCSDTGNEPRPPKVHLEVLFDIAVAGIPCPRPTGAVQAPSEGLGRIARDF